MRSNVRALKIYDRSLFLITIIKRLFNNDGKAEIFESFFWSCYVRGRWTHELLDRLEERMNDLIHKPEFKKGG